MLKEINLRQAIQIVNKVINGYYDGSTCFEVTDDEFLEALKRIIKELEFYIEKE
jgi:hypothetical protein